MRNVPRIWLPDKTRRPLACQIFGQLFAEFGCPSSQERAVDKSNALSSGRRCRCHSRQDKLDSRSLAGFALENEPAPQTIRDDAVDDMQAEASAALVGARREDRSA